MRQPQKTHAPTHLGSIRVSKPRRLTPHDILTRAQETQPQFSIWARHPFAFPGCREAAADTQQREVLVRQGKRNHPPKSQVVSEFQSAPWPALFFCFLCIFCVSLVLSWAPAFLGGFLLFSRVCLQEANLPRERVVGPPLFFWGGGLFFLLCSISKNHRRSDVEAQRHSGKTQPHVKSPPIWGLASCPLHRADARGAWGPALRGPLARPPLIPEHPEPPPTPKEQIPNPTP